MSTSTQGIPFEEMVAGLVKPGREIVAEMNTSKSIALAVALNHGLRASRLLDKTKKFAVYNKGVEIEDPTQAGVNILDDIGFRLTPYLAHKLHMALGLFGEAGEILEATVNEIMTGFRDKDNELEESGDIEFYHEGFRQCCDFDRGDALEANVLKLGKRYRGHKYTDQQAIERADKVGQEGAGIHIMPTTADLDMRDRFGGSAASN